jgi:hypothetical protein
VSISIQEFEKILDEAEGRLIQNIRASLIKNALRMEGAAKKNATTFPRVDTGRLRNSIIGSVIQFQDDEFLILRAGGQERGVPSSPYSTSADVVYAAVQEFGGGPNRIKPKFYLRRARDKVLPRVSKDISVAMNFALNGKDFR